MKRTFIAIEPPERVKKDIERIQKELIIHKVKGRFIAPDNSHLTLVFLGWTKDEKMGVVKDILASAVAETPPLSLRFTQLNCFPSAQLAKVLYWSLERNETLNSLVYKLQKGLRRHKIWFDQKPFVPHLTVARFRSPHNLERVLPFVKAPITGFKVKRVGFWESRLTRCGPVYTPLRTIST
jgi:2'-5' RNA ligase